MKITFYFFLASIIAVTLSCNKDTEFWPTQSRGIIKEQGNTTYQYGTHVLTDDTGQVVFVLTSDKKKLDNYLDKKVEVKGYLKKDLKLKGPDWMEVTKVKEE